jgi:hypothetical protein
MFDRVRAEKRVVERLIDGKTLKNRVELLGQLPPCEAFLRLPRRSMVFWRRLPLAARCLS